MKTVLALLMALLLVGCAGQSSTGYRPPLIDPIVIQPVGFKIESRIGIQSSSHGFIGLKTGTTLATPPVVLNR
jgi:hypothetical protein